MKRPVRPYCTGNSLGFWESLLCYSFLAALIGGMLYLIYRVAQPPLVEHDLRTLVGTLSKEPDLFDSGGSSRRRWSITLELTQYPGLEFNVWKPRFEGEFMRDMHAKDSVYIIILQETFQKRILKRQRGIFESHRIRIYGIQSKSTVYLTPFETYSFIRRQDIILLIALLAASIFIPLMIFPDIKKKPLSDKK